MNTGAGFLVVFKDGRVRIAPTIESFAPPLCSTLQCSGCPGRHCEIRSAIPIEKILDEEGVEAIREFLISGDVDTSPSVRCRALGMALETGGLPALPDSESYAIGEFLKSGDLESGPCIRSMAINSLVSAAEGARNQNVLC